MTLLETQFAALAIKPPQASLLWFELKEVARGI